MRRKSKRIVGLLLAVLTLQFPVLPLSGSAETDSKNINVPNASFEEAAGTWATGWSHMDTSDATFEVDTDYAHSGKNSLHIIASDEKKQPWAATTVTGLVPNSFYELSMFVDSSVSSNTNRGTGVKLEFYSGSPLSVETAVSASAIPNEYPNGPYMLNTNARWVEHKTIFNVPEDTKIVKIYLRIYGHGEAWFDDVSLKFSGGPAKYEFDTDKVFHYKEETGGDAYVKVNSFYEGQGVAEDTFADFVVKKGEEICEEAQNVPATNMEARYTYSTSYMEPYEKYTLYCTIKNSKGEILENHQQNLYVVDRPSMMSEDGYLMVDGKRFNPISAYHVEVEDYAKAVEGGINTVQVGYGNAYLPNEELRASTLEALSTHNLKGIFCLYVGNKMAGHPDIFENTKQIVEIMKDNPNIIAYALQDEPFLMGDDKEKRIHAEEAYLAIRKIDKVHPIYITDKRREYISKKYCDILCVDSYAHNGDTRNVTRDSVRAWEETKDKNGFWELAATYNINGAFPTMNDARNSIYRAFEEGARGMGYYSFSDAGKIEGHNQIYEWDLWEDYCKFNKEEAPILFDRFVNGNATVFNQYDDGAGTDNAIDSMRWFDWFVGEDMYLVAHNRGRASASVTIPLRSRNGKIKIDGFKAEPVGLTTQKAMSGNGEMTLTLGSEEIALFKIIPDQKVDLSRINESSFDDLEGYDWAQDAIAALDAKNILNTVLEGKYGPGEAITRLDFVSFLVRALGLTEEGEAFPDCDIKEIKIAQRAGITNGDTDGNFRPYDTITRQDIMTTACRALNAAPTDKEIPAFSDWNMVSEYARDAVKTMVQAEVIVGNGDGTLNPLGLATRAEAAVMLNRILNTEFNKAVVNAPDVPKPDVKEEITFSGNPDENTIQIWNNATDLLKALGVSLPKIEKSVTCGEFENAVSAFIDAKYEAFEDDLKAITYCEAVEALVKLLGYEAYAPSHGGYMAMAAQLELIKGLSPEEHIRAGELAMLLANAADIKTAERTDFGKNEEYRESNDTLLSLYRNIHKVKGVVEETYYTGADVRRGEILLDGEVYTGGEAYHRQRVVAFAEFTEDEKKILYIEPASGTKVVTVDAEDILEADTSVIRYETENGKDELVSIAGATVYVNGEKKVATGADFRPEQGTVSLVFTSGTVTSILVEKYENRIVQSVYKEDNTVYFKNGKELILENEKVRYYIDFEAVSLNEWNVLSVYTRGDGSLYKVRLSAESVQGAPSEISEDGILLGESVYPVSKACFGTPALGVTAKFYLDVNGKIAAVDDKNVTPEYGYFTAMEGGKGISGSVSVRIFTKKGELKVFETADSVKLNGIPQNNDALLSAPVLLDGKTVKQQLIIYEVNGNGEITGIETAQDALGCTRENMPSGFAKVYYTESVNGGQNHYIGYNVRTIGGKYRISDKTVNFIVPAIPSNREKDYSISIGYSRYEHSMFYPNCEIYDWNEDFSAGAVVQTVGNTAKEVGSGSAMAVIVGFGEAIDEEGMPRKAIRMLGSKGEETVYYAEDDFRVILNAQTLTDTNGGETEVTKIGYVPILNEDMPLSSLNIGDVVQFEAGGADGKTITAMCAVLRVKSPLVGENSSKSVSATGNYSDRTVAYGPVLEVWNDGISMLPGKFERVFFHYSTGADIAPVIIFDKNKETYEVKTLEAVRKGDMVFCRRANPYLEFFVVYR